MENNSKIPSMGRARIDDAVDWSNLTDADFASATAAEKEDMVEYHKSVSYWADAFRRFKKNTVSVVAFFVFLVIALFAFIGPYFIPYGYEEQFRNSMKLGPFEYSESEEVLRTVLETADAAYSNNAAAGSLTSVKKGFYGFKYGGEWYCFEVKKAIKKSIIILDMDAPVPFYYVAEEDYLAAGISDATELKYSVEHTLPAGYSEIEFYKSVFPHMFGTDSAGRDIMARCMYGGRVSILIGIVASLIVLIIGSIYGAISGLCGGVVDFIMMRIVELIYSVPEVLIVLLLQVVLKTPLQNWFDTSTSGFVQSLGTLGVGIVSIFITFALLYWVSMARIVRGQVLQLKQQEYVMAATVLGASNARIIKRHLLPNCVGQITIATCLQIPSAIFLESFLSFLGLGISAPMSSLGSLCSDAIDTITIYPYRLIFPAIILSLIVLSLNLVGDGLRDALDPRLKK